MFESDFFISWIVYSEGLHGESMMMVLIFLYGQHPCPQRHNYPDLHPQSLCSPPLRMDCSHLSLMGSAQLEILTPFFCHFPLVNFQINCFHYACEDGFRFQHC